MQCAETNNSLEGVELISLVSSFYQFPLFHVFKLNANRQKHLLIQKSLQRKTHSLW